MITTIAKALNTVVQIVARAIAFVFGVLLAAVCWPLIKIISILTTLLWWIAFVPSWISGHLLMFALDLDPVQCKKQLQFQEELNNDPQLQEDMKKLKSLIQESIRASEKKSKETEKTDDPS